ncbi:uncharacterized protein EURHEDRAFT_418351, partial [Aspergillus ruber CBS 135680]
DIIGLAETRSGKTPAFAPQILQGLMSKQGRLHSIILTPTRKLARQVVNVLEDLGGLMSVSCTLFIGRRDML